MSTESLINCEHVSCTYGNAAVLDDVYMQVNRGEFVGVVGPSGSGKTTLLKAILGTHPVAHGSITMQPKLTLGYVPQVETVDWYFPVTVEEVIVMTRSKSTWWPRITQTERKAVRDVLDRLGIGDVANQTYSRTLWWSATTSVSCARNVSQPRHFDYGRTNFWS